MKTVWEKADAKTVSAIMTFGDEYRTFLGRTKTEREFVKEARALAEQQGFKDLAAKKGKLKAGDKVYAVNRGKNLCLFVIGKKPLTDGLNILGAHIDSPRLDLKQHPVYEKDGLVLLDTHYYGGIKKYQWVARPMALHGVVCKTDGTAVEICIGEKADDPVVGISDLLIHLAGEQMKKPASTVVEGEALNLLAASRPTDSEKEPVRERLLAELKERCGCEIRTIGRA